MKTKRVRIMIAVSILLLLPIAVYAADMAEHSFPANLRGGDVVVESHILMPRLFTAGPGTEGLLFHRLQALRAEKKATTEGFDVPAGVPYGSIAGRVTNAGGNGIENVEVDILLSTDGSAITNTYTDADGYYTAVGLLTGSYKVYFYGGNAGYVSEWYNDKGYIPMEKISTTQI